MQRERFGKRIRATEHNFTISWINLEYGNDSIDNKIINYSESVAIDCNLLLIVETLTFGV